MKFYELSFRSHVDNRPLSDFLAASLGVDREFVGEQIEYWDRVGTDYPLAIGVKVQWSELGYKTFLKWIQEAEVPGPQLLSIALAAAREFDTEVAAGDILETAESRPGQFVVVKPDGTVYKAVELCNGDLFEVVPDLSPIEPFQLNEFLGQMICDLPIVPYK